VRQVTCGAEHPATSERAVERQVRAAVRRADHVEHLGAHSSKWLECDGWRDEAALDRPP